MVHAGNNNFLEESRKKFLKMIEEQGVSGELQIFFPLEEALQNVESGRHLPKSILTLANRVAHAKSEDKAKLVMTLLDRGILRFLAKVIEGK